MVNPRLIKGLVD